MGDRHGDRVDLLLRRRALDVAAELAEVLRRDRVLPHRADRLVQGRGDDDEERALLRQEVLCGLPRVPLRLLLWTAFAWTAALWAVSMSAKAPSTSTLPASSSFWALRNSSCTLSLCPKSWASESATLRPPSTRRGSGLRGPSPDPRSFALPPDTFPFRCCSFPFASAPSRFGTEEALAAIAILFDTWNGTLPGSTLRETRQRDPLSCVDSDNRDWDPEYVRVSQPHCPGLGLG